MDVTKFTRKQLLALPVRHWCKISEYKSILLVPTYEMHESGWRLIAIVGCGDDGKPKEIAAFCDDVEWQTPRTDYGIQMDMIPKTNICRFHSHSMKFRVGACCSSTEVAIVGKPYLSKMGNPLMEK